MIIIIIIPIILILIVIQIYGHKDTRQWQCFRGQVSHGATWQVMMRVGQRPFPVVSKQPDPLPCSYLPMLSCA